MTLAFLTVLLIGAVPDRIPAAPAGEAVRSQAAPGASAELPEIRPAAGPADPLPRSSEVPRVDDARVADSTITIGRLQYGGGGDWYANPSSLPNLLEAIRERTGLPVASRESTVTPLDPRLRDYPFLHMTGHGNVSFSEREREALREYLLSGGFLHADDNYGMDEYFRREMSAIFPDREMVELPPDHPVFHAHYSFPEGLPKIHEHDGGAPEAWGIFHDGRLVVLYTHETDLGNGWEDEAVHGNAPEVREQALRMGVNLFLFAVSQLSP